MCDQWFRKSAFASLCTLILLWSASSNAALQVGDIAPDFTLETIDGEQVSLSEFKGKKAVYLIFWATWCSNCRAEIPTLKKVHGEMTNDIELLAINTSVNDSLKRVKRYTEKHQLPYAVGFDQESAITRLYGVVGTPTQLIIDINGVVRYRNADSPDDLAEHLPELLAIK